MKGRETLSHSLLEALGTVGMGLDEQWARREVITRTLGTTPPPGVFDAIVLLAAYKQTLAPSLVLQPM